MRGNPQGQCFLAPTETMSVKETFVHDLHVIGGVLKKIAFEVGRALFWGILYFAMAIWFIFNVILDIALLLTIRDGVQWFLGTNRRRR